ncbi:RNA polymerase-binding transcription factor DksA [Haloferula luteola]|uniref:RNA polymerase-binding transcription factor DksA n=1 Tax=Haloferula luteola TaxID=595692 RepID=A0A840VCG5_9BACT|nr:hypothetical protein [Haloferula luteola]MBB5351610.1 RNA polymerase-binding transcription factor DksA [Haloferula luteola]
MSEESKSLQDQWLRAAARTSRKINLGWWLQALSAPLVIGSGIATLSLLWLRRHWPAVESPVWWASSVGWVLLLAIVAWWTARRRFESPHHALVRIEDTMSLRNALTTARCGVGRWPALPPQIDAGLSWNWTRVTAPPLAALALLLAGHWIPVSALPGADSTPPEAPLAWENIQADLDRLDQEDVIDEDYIEEMEKKLEALREKDPDEWFDHASLEATDALERQHQSELERLSREATQADHALANLEQGAGKLSTQRKDELLQQFDNALQGLQSGALKPNSELLDQLQQLDPSQLGQLTEEQMRQLRENLQKTAAAAKSGQCEGSSGQGEEWMDELMAGNQPGQGEGPIGPDGSGSGSGGVSRGPGEAGGVLGNEGPSIKTGALETLQAMDLSRTLPGDLLELQNGQHEVDDSATAPQAGGSVSQAGAGGDRVWRESLDPDEQRALKKFFE